MPTIPASSSSASVSILPNVTSPYLTEARSNTGANARHGPHQLAQKSSSTTPGFSMVVLKVACVISTVAMAQPVSLPVGSQATC